MTFEELVDEAYDTLPKSFKKHMYNVSITVQDWPTREQLYKVKMKGQLLLGLYEGAPRTVGSHYRFKYPDKITLFKNPLIMISHDLESLKKNIASTLFHEIGHHFGMSEEELERAQSVNKSVSNTL